MSERKLEAESLTKAIYHSGIAKKYFEAFKDECHLEAKRAANHWVNKIKSLLSDVYTSLTPEARELFAQEISAGDVLFIPSMTEKLLRMNEPQREFVETMCVLILRGEKIEVQDMGGKSLTVNN